MSNQYHLADGSPRYGSRTTGTGTDTGSDEAAPAPVIKPGVREEEAAEFAARLGLDEVAAATDRRLSSAWAYGPDPLVTALRQDHPEELTAARNLVKLQVPKQYLRGR